MSKNKVQTFDFSDKGLWVPVYLPLFTKKARRKILYGSRDSAKSSHVSRSIILRMLEEKFKGVLARKTYDSIRESQFDEIKQVVHEWGLEDVFTFNTSPIQIRCTLTGARLIGKGLDKPGKAKSMKGVSLVWYEEADEFEESDFTQTTLSIRGHGIEEWITFNSPHTDHWILKRFFPMHEDGQPDLSFEEADGMHTWVTSTDPTAVILHTCYKHNPYCNEERRVNYDWMEKYSPEEYRTSGLGLMGRRNVGSLWMRAFSRPQHVRPVKYNPNLPIHLAFDQNNLPYSTMLCIQSEYLGDILEIRVFKTYCLKPPSNTTEDLCMSLVYDYGEYDFEAYYYGDTTGRNEVQRKERNELAHHYDAVDKHLAPYLNNRSRRVAPSAPSIKGRQRFMTVMLKEGTYLRFVVDPSCKELIGDFEHLVEDTNGGFIKKKVKDKETEQTWEERGHCFTGDTLISTEFGPVPISSIEPGTRVWTRFGLRPVLKRFDNGKRTVHAFRIAGTHIECTPDHKFYTANRGFVPVCELQQGDIIEKQTPWNTSLSTATSSPATQKASDSVISGTSVGASRSMGARSRSTCTGTCGSSFAALFRKALTSITRMATRCTTRSRTSSASKIPSTCPCTPKRIGRILNSDSALLPTWSDYVSSRSHGTQARKEERGMCSTAKKHSHNALPDKCSASSAKPTSRPQKEETFSHAATSVGGCCGIVTRPDAKASSALSATPPSQQHELDASDIAALRASVSHGRECHVYDLHVQGQHEYYANGILVHNCMDALINYAYQAHTKLYKSIAKV
jgi:hypothetical protein